LKQTSWSGTSSGINNARKRTDRGRAPAGRPARGPVSLSKEINTKTPQSQHPRAGPPAKILSARPARRQAAAAASGELPGQPENQQIIPPSVMYRNKLVDKIIGDCHYFWSLFLLIQNSNNHQVIILQD
jgi:hypothetical protein